MLDRRVLSALLGCGTAMVGLATLACNSDDVTDADLATVASITVTPPVARIAPGGRVQLHAAVRDGAGTSLTEHEVTWSSSNDDVARVSPRGLVSGRSDGATVVTASSDGKSGSATITVRRSVEAVELVPAVGQIRVAETLELVAITRDQNGNAVTGRRIAWSSSNDQVATVSQTGLVTGLAAGAAKITAMTEGEKGSAVITVVPAQ